jgi:hypothetical protein
MDDLLKNKLFWVVAIVTLMNVSVFFVGKVVIDKAADTVIERLEKDYSPSPYGPGFDPDKVEVVRELVHELRKYNENGEIQERRTSRDLTEMIEDADRWRTQWERDRGANP